MKVSLSDLCNLFQPQLGQIWGSSMNLRAVVGRENAESWVWVKKTHLWAETPRLTRPLMTAMLNNECGENSLIRDLRRLFFLGGKEQEAPPPPFDSLWWWTPLRWAWTHYDSRVVAADSDVLRPGGGCQAKNQDEHRHHEQQRRDHDGFPLPPFKGACGATNEGVRYHQRATCCVTDVYRWTTK